MKRFILSILFIGCISLLHAQLKTDSKLATTTTLPEGTAVSNGKIKVLQGYKAVVSEKDNKIVHIQRVSNNRTSRTGNVTGSFTCQCLKGADDCAVSIVLGSVVCVGSTCSNCFLHVIIKPGAGLLLTRETKGEIWKKFSFPEKTQ